MERAAGVGPVAAPARRQAPIPKIDPASDREAKTLMQQLDASTDADEQAGLQSRMRQILDRIKGTR